MAEDQWAWWRNALATKTVEEIHDGHPQSGFYRNRRKGQMAQSVAFWIDTKSGKQRCQVNGEDVEEQRAMEIWPYAAKEPIAHEMFKTHAETGKWPDMDEGALSTLPGQREVIGGNNPPSDPLEILSEQINAARGNISQYASIDSDEKAAAAQSLRARLLELGGDADKKRDAEKRPHLEAGREIDRKWKPLVDLAQNAANAIRDAMRVWEREKDRRAAAAEQKRIQEDAAKAAAQAKKAPEERAIPLKAREHCCEECMMGSPIYVPCNKPATKVIGVRDGGEGPYRMCDMCADHSVKNRGMMLIGPYAGPAPAPAAPIKGAYGRAAAVTMVNVVTIADQDAVYGVFKGRQEVKDLLQKLAERAVKDGHTVAGTTVTKEKDIR